MDKTIIIFTLFLKNEFFYPSFIHFHAREYVKMGYRVIVFAQRSVLPIVHILKKDKEYNIDGVTVIVGNRLSISGFFPNSHINFNGLFYYLSVRNRVKKIIKNENVILLDAHTFHCEGYTAYLLKKKYSDIKTTITFHGSDLEAVLASDVETKRVVKVSKYIDQFICVSDKLNKKLKKLNIKNVKTVYNGINHFKLHKYKRENVIISCGSLIESKNFKLLIDSFFEFHKLYPNYKLKIIGSGELENELLEKINSYELNDCVFLLGELPNDKVYEEYEKAQIFALISSPEGFGIVYPEAMYCGCVTIGTKNEGIDGFIKDGENGFLIESSVNSIVNIFKFIIENDCSNIIINGRRDARKLTWEKNCSNYFEK